MVYRSFLKKPSFDPKNPFQNFEKPMMDLNSPALITLGQILWNIVLLSKILSFDPKNPFQNFEKLLTDSDSPPPITFGQTLWNIVLSSKYLFR
jgi:hypothetical protein